MSIFDLVLIASVLLSVATLSSASAIAATGHFALAWRVLRGWILCATAYLGVVVIVSLFTRPRLLAYGEDQCFDDWCIAVERVERMQSAAARTYAVTFRLSSRARRVSQRERNVVAYLRDADGRRYDPDSADGEPFAVLLEPGQSVRTMRFYDLPPGAEPPRLVIAHEGGFPIGWFIIGEGPFAKGTLVAMQ
jgi:hypothetical protein